jgi:DNA modification methylase
MVNIINQKISQEWASYHGDCVFVMSNLPDNSVDFNVHSPPFLSLYIYSDSIADLGNSESEAQFFEGYQYALKEMCRVLKPGKSIAIHCKDTMRYMSSHNYAGLYDFPGEIIRCAQESGLLFQRWITIWKDPVVEMQRTKTYGLLHKSFQVRAEVTRQGCADYVLIFNKPLSESGSIQLAQERVDPLLESVKDRMIHQWSQEGETISYNEVIPGMALSMWDKPIFHYTNEFIQELSDNTQPGRLAVIRCQVLSATTGKGESCSYDMMGDIIKRFQASNDWKFHSRCALTDGGYLVAFRNWNKVLRTNYSDLNGQVTHSLKAPASNYQFMTEEGQIAYYKNGKHPDYIGNNPPTQWHDDTYYSILVWQRYASPVWFDLDGLPEVNTQEKSYWTALSLDGLKGTTVKSNEATGFINNIWFDIEQTNVLNQGLKDEEEQRHICPLQLDLIERLIIEYTQPGEVVYSPYGGIGSEGYKALLLNRKVILSELKESYWRIGCKYLQEAELLKLQPVLEGFG